MINADLRMTFPTARHLPPDPAEAALRVLYAHMPGTVRLGMIQSADGKAAGPDGTSRSLNGPQDLRILRTLRSVADVILVGAQTLRVEGQGSITLPQALREARTGEGLTPVPHLAIVAASGELPPGVDPATAWIVTTASADAGARLGDAWHGRVIVAGDDTIDGGAALAALSERSYRRVLCEGGPRVASSLLTPAGGGDALVDDYCLTTSEAPGGADAAPVPAIPAGFERAHRLEGGGFAIDRWTRAPA